MSQLVSIRREATAAGDTAAVQALWDSALRFVLAVEARAGRTGYGLRATLLSQVLVML